MGAVRNSNANEGEVSFDSLLQSALALQIEIFHRLKSIAELTPTYKSGFLNFVWHLFNKEKLKKLRAAVNQLSALSMLELTSDAEIQDFIEKSRIVLTTQAEINLPGFDQIAKDLEVKLKDLNTKLVQFKDDKQDNLMWERKLYKHLRAQAEERLMLAQLRSYTFTDEEELQHSDLRKKNTQEFHYERIEQSKEKLNLNHPQLDDFETLSRWTSDNKQIEELNDELNSLLAKKIQNEIIHQKEEIIKGLEIKFNSQEIAAEQLKETTKYFALRALLDDLFEDLVFQDKALLLRWHYDIPDVSFYKLFDQLGCSDIFYLDRIHTLIGGYLASDLDISKGRFSLTQENLDDLLNSIKEILSDAARYQLNEYKTYYELNKSDKILTPFFEQRIKLIKEALHKIDDKKFVENIRKDNSSTGALIRGVYNTLNQTLSPMSTRVRTRSKMQELEAIAYPVAEISLQPVVPAINLDLVSNASQDDEIDIPQNKNISQNAVEPRDAVTDTRNTTVPSPVESSDKTSSSNTTSYVIGGVVVALTVATVLAFAGPLAPAVVGGVLLAIPAVKGIAGFLGLSISAYTLGLTTLTLGVLTLGSLLGVVEKKIFGNAPSPIEVYAKIKRPGRVQEEQVPLLAAEQDRSDTLDVPQNHVNTQQVQKTENITEVKKTAWNKSKAAQTSLSKVSFIVKDSNEVQMKKYTNKYADYVSPTPGKKK